MTDPDDAIRSLSERFDRRRRAHQDDTERALREIWSTAPKSDLAARREFAERVRGYDIAIKEQLVHQNRTTPPAGGKSPVLAQVNLDRSGPLQALDRLFASEFALAQHYPKTRFDNPTIYCESLEEFYAPWAEVLELSESARQAAIASWMAEAQERAKEGGIYGVFFPGRGCYLNGWLFAFGRVSNPVAALKDPAILPHILRTAAHEKIGHGFISSCTELGLAKQRVNLGRYDLAQRFGHKVRDDPLSALLERKHALLFISSLYLEEGWATWIEHHLAPRLLGSGNTPAQPPYTLEKLCQAIEVLRRDADADLLNALDALTWALTTIFLSDAHEAAILHKAVLIIQALSSYLAEPISHILGQPLAYIIGYLLLARIEAQQGALCTLYNVAIAANVAYDIANLGIADLELVLQSEPRMNLNTRLCLLSRLVLTNAGDLSELAKRAREELSLSAPANIT